MLQNLTGWGRESGLRFNPEKTVAVLFTRKDPTNFVCFEGKMLPYSDNVRYLGVDLDSKLHWKIHINNKIKLAKRALMSIANVTQNSFGPSPKLMHWTYNGIIKPM